ncbi:hypothetical protein CA7LBN_003870 [Candidozyma auris]|uniref:Major facilitator superfamily (MFS) profile domain-containing protein n=1 Tax=Candidozyma auris TaxID=498019 RepID=A0A8F3AJ13_CANAR|nr:hypothetical protein CA7LBN_003870 [[Candida] auris]
MPVADFDNGVLLKLSPQDEYSSVERRFEDDEARRQIGLFPAEGTKEISNGEGSDDDSTINLIKDRGVHRVESLMGVLYSHKNGLHMRLILGLSILLCAWASSLDLQVTTSIKPWATSAFHEHSMGLGALAIADSIIGAVSRPVWAQIANIISRPFTYFLSIVFYVLGYIIVASSHTISAYIVGSAFSAMGSSGVGFLNRVIVADLTTLKWRGLATEALASPNIINIWYAGYIVKDLGPSNWRWGCFNRTLVSAIVIDFVFQVAGRIVALYDSSYALIVKDWDDQYWTYYNNTNTMAICVFGIITGICMRITRTYKSYQYTGIVLAMIGAGIMIEGRNTSTKTVTMVWSSILLGMGNGLSAPGTSVALQASIPHGDLAICISFLLLTSSIGASLSSAIATAIWQGKMENALRTHMPSTVSDQQVRKFFLNIVALRKYPFDSEVRKAGIKAYREVNFYFYPISIGLQVIRLVAVYFQRSFFLGDNHNGIEDKNGFPSSPEEGRSRNLLPEQREERNWRKSLSRLF